MSTPFLRLAAILIGSLLIASAAPAQDDGGVASTDGGGQTVLESITVPMLTGAPFSLMLSTEWARSLSAGGTFTEVNIRPVKRDSAGRVYQERWLLSPKGSKIPSRMSWIQIEDPVAHTYLECSGRRHICELHTLTPEPQQRYDPRKFQTGPIPGGRGYRTHEDLGADDVMGVPVHRYRDSTVLNPGVLGNDHPMTTLREFSYAEALGINLRSVLEAPQTGRQQFTVTEITLSEPEPRYFQAPEGYSVIDMRDGVTVP